MDAISSEAYILQNVDFKLTVSFSCSCDNVLGRTKQAKERQKDALWLTVYSHTVHHAGRFRSGRRGSWLPCAHNQEAERAMVLSPFSSFRYLFCYCFFMYMFFLHICLCTMCMPSAQRGQKTALGPLGLELRMVAGHRVDAGVSSGSAGRAACTLSC